MKKNYIKPDFTVRTISFRRIIMTSGGGPTATSVHTPGISYSSYSRGYYDEEESDDF